MNVAENLERSALLFPHRPAISEGQVEISYAELNDKAGRVAAGLVRLGMKPGDHIALYAPNSADWIAFYFGALKAGGVAVTMSSMLKPDEVASLLQDTRPKVLFTWDEKLEDLKGQSGRWGVKHLLSPGPELDRLSMTQAAGSFKAVHRERDETASILFTGGTTGTPKGVMLTHENINSAIFTVAFNERSTERDRALCFLPFNHVFGQMHIMNATILSGGCLELLPSFDLERVLGVLAAGRVTKLFAVPTVYVRFLALDDLKTKLGHVRYCFSAAASMAAELVRQWKERTGLAIHEAYGLTESASMVTYNHYHRHVIGSVGTPVGTVEVQILDQEGRKKAVGEEGEICIRGRNIMKGYFNRPAETSAAFWNDWFRSGDIGVLDGDGYLYIVDRLKDMIITGGENVYPKEVEEALYTYPDVQECAVIGLPDREWGERVTALIIPRAGRVLDRDRLIRHLKSRLSPFKVPKEYRMVEELPKSPAGKILKREIRKQVLTGSKEQSGPPRP